ncbi:hypothetical protein ALC56_15013, partial [Trachymyrmex septentrionalis]
WIITSRSVIYLLEQLRNLGFKYLNLRNLNQDLKIFFVRHGNIVNSKEIPFEESDLFKNVEVRTLKRINFDELGVKDCFVFSCVSGYFVKNL